jgi:hypothetical protein
MEGYEKAGCIFETFWDEPVLIQPSGQGGTNWSPMPYDPDTGYLYVPGTIRTSVFSRVPSRYTTGQRYTNGTQAPPIGSPLSGTFTAIVGATNEIAWQHKMPYRMGGGGGSTVTAGGLLLRGEPDALPRPRCRTTARSCETCPNRGSSGITECSLACRCNSCPIVGPDRHARTGQRHHLTRTPPPVGD